MVPVSGETRERNDRWLGWAGEMAALLADAQTAADAGDVALTKHRLTLLALCWRRRPTGCPPRRRRGG